MIIDKLENASLYYGIDPNLTLALKYLEKIAGSISGTREKKYLIPEVMVKVNEYDTVVGERKWESHLIHTDLQYVAEGEECFGFASDEKSYDPVPTEGKDQIIWKAKGGRIYLPKGYFHIFFPGEVHMTKLAVEGRSEHVRKVVFKVQLKEMRTVKKGEI